MDPALRAERLHRQIAADKQSAAAAALALAAAAAAAPRQRRQLADALNSEAHCQRALDEALTVINPKP